MLFSSFPYMIGLFMSKHAANDIQTFLQWHHLVTTTVCNASNNIKHYGKLTLPEQIQGLT